MADAALMATEEVGWAEGTFLMGTDPPPALPSSDSHSLEEASQAPSGREGAVTFEGRYLSSSLIHSAPSLPLGSKKRVTLQEGRAGGVSSEGESSGGESSGEESSTGADVEWHPLIPFLPQEARVLFLGSFPPQRKRWCMDFFYPNFTNDHWRIEGLAFYGDAQYFVDEERKTFRLTAIVEHLKRRGIGFFDTALAVRRLADNASDKFLEVVVPTDIHAMVAHRPHLKAIVTTGEKATETIALALGMTDGRGKAVLPKVETALPSPIEGIELYRLPSSSRAYPMALTKKAEAYKRMFERYGLISNDSVDGFDHWFG